MAAKLLATAEVVAAIIAQRAAGTPLDAIAANCGVSRALVSKVLLRNGISSRLTPEDEQRIVGAVTAGRTVRDIAAEHDIDPSSVSRICKKHGLASRGSGPKRDGDRETEIVRRYQGGESATEIAAALSVGENTVYRALRRAGVAAREEHVVVTDEIVRAVVETATSGSYTGDEVAEASGVSKSTVFRILGDRGIHLPKNPRQHTLDESVFDTLTPEGEYWIGFFFADGAVEDEDLPGGERQRYLASNLGIIDRDHLVKFRSFLKSTHAIGHIPATTSTLRSGRDIEGGPAASFRVRSNRLVDRLVEYGMGPVKADRTPVPTLASSRHFWRGAVDGDGSVGSDVAPHFYPNISLNGPPLLLTGYQKFLLSTLNLSLRQGPVSTIQRVGTSGSTALDIIRLLYENAPVALERKAARAHALLDGFRGKFLPYPKAR